MKRDIILSVIIPFYNSESTAEKCVKSILNQPFRQLEIIAVDDGSEDNTYNILTDISGEDDRLKVFSKENGGVSQARNYGLLHMLKESDYFTFVDSDDLIENNIYEKAIDILNSNSKIDMAVFSHYSVSEDGSVKNNGLSEEIVSGNDVRNIIVYDNYPYGGGYVWNRVYRKAGFWSESRILFREDIDFYEDKIFLMDLMKSPCQLYMMPDFGYTYFDKERRSNATKLLQYLIGLRELAYSEGISSDSRNKCMINYAGGFSSALNFAMDNNDSEMIGILNELLNMESEEMQQILAIAFQKFSKKS